MIFSKIKKFKRIIKKGTKPLIGFLVFFAMVVGYLPVFEIPKAQAGVGQQAGRIWSSGVENQTVTAGVEFTTITGTPTVNTTTVRSGAASLRTNPTSATQNIEYNFASANVTDAFFFRGYIYVASAPAVQTKVMVIRDSTPSEQVSLRMNTDRTLELWNEEDSAQVGSDSSAIALNTWTRLEIGVNATTIATTTLEARIDGTSFANGTVNHANGIQRFQVGVITTATTADFYWDDFGINQDNNSFLDNWVGDGKIIHLRPNGNGTNTAWTGDFTAVDEITPNDATDTIVCSASQTEDYTLTDATANGVASSDTIRLMQGGVRVSNGNSATSHNYTFTFLDGSNVDGTGAISTVVIATANTNYSTIDDTAPANYQYTSYNRPGTTVVTPWTPATVDSASIRLATTDCTPVTTISTLWALVEYTSTAEGGNTGGRLFTSGFELQSTTANMEFTAVTSATIDTSTFRSGAASLLTDAASESAEFDFESADTADDYFFRGYIRVTSAPGGQTILMSAYDTGNTHQVSLRMNTDRTLELWNEEDGVQVGSDSSAIPLNAWTRLELKVDAATLGSTAVEGRINGTAFASGTINLANGVMTMRVGNQSAVTGSFNWDDLAVNKGTGSFQNTYPGEGSVVHLSPNANGAVQAWTLSPATCNSSSVAFQCVDDVTPNDATDILTSTTANQQTEFDFVNTSTAGIPASSTVTLVSTGVRFGNSAATASAFSLHIRDVANRASTAVPEIGINTATYNSNGFAAPRLYPLTLYDRPHSTSAWTLSDLDSARMGARLSIDGGTNTVNLSTLWMLVEYVAPATTTLADGTDPGNSTIAPGASATHMDSFTLQRNYGSTSVSALTVTLGVANSFNNIATVEIKDVTGVTDQCTDITNPASTTLNFTGCSLSVTSAVTEYRVYITPKTHANMPAVPGAEYATTGTVTSITVAAGGTTGTDTDSAAITIDNLSPSNATSTSGTAGNAAVTLAWTASSSADISSSVILRWAASTPGGEVPVEGMTYTAGNTISTATVACVISSTQSQSHTGIIDGTGGSAGCNTTALTNGQDYSYRVFQLDSRGNYDAGVTFTGSPFNPGVVGFTVSGTVYANDGVTALGSAKTVGLRVNGTLAGTGDGGAGLDDTDGSGNFSFTGVSATAGSTITLYISGETETGNTVTISDGSSSITSVSIFDDHFIVRADDGSTAITILDLLDYDEDQDTTNMVFDADDLATDTVYIEDGNKFLLWTGDTFTPGGTITMDPSDNSATLDGDFEIGSGATLNMATFTLTIGGDYKNSGTVTESGSPQITAFSATTTGHTIDLGTGGLDRANFTGGGGWSFTDASNTLAGDLSITSGEISGTNSITVNGGDVTGNGTINLTGGTFTINTAGSFGGDTAWTFSNLTIGAAGNATTTASGTGSITVSGVLTVDAGDTLNAGSKVWNLGSGTPLVVNGTFTAGSSTVRYVGTSTTSITALTYNNLEIGTNADSSAVSYGADGGTLTINGSLTIGNASSTNSDTLDLNTADPNTTVSGDVTITSRGILLASGTATTNFGGNYTNNGTFTANGGTVTFTATDTGNTLNGALTGSSLFSNVTFNGIDGQWTNTSVLWVNNNLIMTAGSLIGTADVNADGPVTGNGVINRTGGTFTTTDTGNFGGDTNWTFHNLNIGTGVAITTTGTGSGNITVSNVLTIATNGTLNAGSKTWILSGSGTPFVRNGTFTAQTSTFQYTGTSATNITATTYNTLTLDPSSGTPTYTLGTGGSQTIRTDGTFTMSADAIVTAATHNPALDIRGDLTLSNGTSYTKGSGTTTFQRGAAQVLTDNGTTKQDLGAVATATASTSVSTATGIRLTSLNIAGSTTWDISGDTMEVIGTGTPLTVTGTFTITGSTVLYSSTGATNIAATTYNNLTLNPSSGTPTYTLGTASSQTIRINTTFTMSGDSTTTAATHNPALDIRGDWTINTGGVYTAGSGTTTFQRGGGNTQQFTDGTSSIQNLGTVVVAANVGNTTLNLASNTRVTNLTINASQTITHPSGSLIVTGSGTPFVNSGTFTPSTGTLFRYTGSSATTIAAATYYNLQSRPGSAGVTHTLGAGVFTINGTFTAGDGTLATTLDADANDPTLDINGSFVNSANSTFVASNSGTFTTAVDWTNSGTFTHSSGTVTLDTTATSTITGATTFFNFSVTTAGKTVRFTSGQTFTTNGLLTLTGTNGNNVVITSSDGATQFTINHQGTESVSYVTVSYSACHGSSTDIDVSNGTPGASVGACWMFGVMYEGTVYSDEGSTLLTSGPAVKLVVNGTKSYTTTANGSGVFQFPTVVASSGQSVAVFLDTNGGAQANLVFRAPASGAQSGLNLYQNRVIVRHEDAGPITNANLDVYDNAGDGDMMFTVTTNNAVFEDGAKLIVWTGDTYTPGGTVTTDPSASSSSVDGDLLIQSGATLSMGTNALSVGGDFVNSGTFSESGSPQVTTFTATSTGHTIDNGTGDLDNVTFNGSSGGWSFVDASNTIAGDLAMTTGTLSGTSSITVNGGDVTGNGTINLTGGTFTINTAGSFGGDTAWTFSNLTIGAAGNATTTATGSGSITTSGVLTIDTGDTLNAGSKTWILSGSGTPFVRNGTFTAQTSTFQYTGTSANINQTTYFSLTLGGTGTYTTPGSAYFVRGNLVINSGASISNGGGSLNFNGGSTSTWTDNNVNPVSPGLVVVSSGGSNTTVNLNSNVRADRLTVDASQTFNLNGSNRLEIAGSVGAGNGPLNVAGNFNASTGVVRFVAGLNSNIQSLTYYDLEVYCVGSTHSATSGNLIIQRNLTVGDGSNSCTFNLDNNDPITDVDNNLTIAASGNLVASASAGFSVGGNWTRSGTFSNSSGTITFDSVSTGRTITGATGGSAFHAVIFNGSGGGWSFVGDSAFAGDLTVTAGTLSGTSNLTVNGGDVTGNGTINLTGGTFTINTAGSFGGDTAWTFSNLTIGAAGNATTTATGSGSITTSGVLTIDTGDTLNAGSKTWILSGSGTPFVRNGTFTAQTSTFQYTGTSATNITPATYNHLVLAPAGTVTHTLATASSQTIITNDFTLDPTSGTLTVTAATHNPTLNIMGDLLIASDALYTPGSGTTTFMKGGTQTITDNTAANGQNLGAVVVASNVSNTTLNLATKTGMNTLTINSNQTFSLNGANRLILLGNGTPLVVNGTFNPSTGIVRYSSGSPTNITATTYYDLEINPGAGAITHTTQAGTMTVSRDLSIAGTATGIVNFDTNDTIVNVGRDLLIDTNGTLTASNTSVLTVGRNFTRNGTFNANSGGIAFNDNTQISTIAGATTFNNFSVTTAGKTVRFTSGQTFTINGLLNIAGSSGNDVIITSSDGSTQFTINHQGTESINHITVSYSACDAGSTDITVTTGTQGVSVGVCWKFTTLIGQGSYRFFENINGAVEFGTGGVTTSATNSSTHVQAVLAEDGTNLYIASKYSNLGWRFEKRLMTNGSLVSGFGTSGVIEEDLSSVSALPYDMAIDDTYMYVVGEDGTDWRIEKRKLSDGALCTAAACGTEFGTNGVVTGASTSNKAQQIVIDDQFMFVMGSDNNSDWRTEKRLLSNGNLDTNFGNGGVITHHSDTAFSGGFGTGLALYGNNLYILGTDLNADLRIEKRNIYDGSLMNDGFGTGGIVSGDTSIDEIQSNTLLIDSTGTYMYLSGALATSPKAQKRLLSDGSLVSGFGTGGIQALSGTRAYGMAIDDLYMYTVGRDSNNDWLLQKRNLSDGDLVTTFGTSGVVTDVSATSSAYKVILDGAAMYIFGSYDANDDWRIQKRLKYSGALASSTQPAVGLPLALSNTPAAIDGTGKPVRLRMILNITGAGLPSNAETFKLQYASRSGTCDVNFTGESYADITTSTPISFYDNSALTDGDNMFASPLDPTDGNTKVTQKYEEANNFTNATGTIPVNQDGIWDFALYENGASQGSAYCIRAVKSTGTPLDSYAHIPEITIPVPQLTQFGFVWRNDDAGESSASNLLQSNTPLNNDWYVDQNRRLRVGISNTGAVAATGLQFRLEYASGACLSGWTEVPTSPGSDPWVMASSGNVSNSTNTSFSTALKKPSNKVFTPGRLMTTANQTGSLSLLPNQFTELEFNIKPTSNVVTGTNYCFRVTNSGTATWFNFSENPKARAFAFVFVPRGAGFGNAGGEGLGSGGNQGGGGQGGGGGNPLAVGVATISSGAVTGVNMINGGDYDSAPTVNFCGGGGSGASGTAVLTGRAVTSVTINSGGSNYSTAPTVVFGSSCPSGGGGGGGGGGDTGYLSGERLFASVSQNQGINLLGFLGGIFNLLW